MPGDGLSLPVLICGQEKLRAGFRFLLEARNDGLAAGEDDPDGFVSLVDLDAKDLEE